MHLNAEEYQHKETQTSDIWINRSTKNDGIINAMHHYRNKQDAYRILCRVVYKMIHRVVIAHQYGKGVMCRHSKQCPRYGNRHPFFLTQNVENIFYGSESQSYAYGIYYTIEMYRQNTGTFLFLFPL